MPGDVRQTVRREFDRLLMDEERDRDARIDDACKRDACIGELLKKRTLTMTNAYAQALSDHRAPDRDAIRAEYARIDAEIAARLNALNLPGVRFSTAYFVPLYYKQVNQLCAGVRIHITDRRALRPVELGVRMVRLMQRLYPDDFKFNAPQPGKRWGIDLLSGTDELRMNQKSADEIVKEWSEEARAFGDVRERYGLYK